MNLTYTTDPATGAKTAPDGTVITDGIAAAVDRLAYLEGWATNVQPPDLGENTYISVFGMQPSITEDEMRDLVRACDLYGVEHEFNDRSSTWHLRLTIGKVFIAMEASKQQPDAAKPTNAKDLLFA